jgi:hypothetical protein
VGASDPEELRRLADYLKSSGQEVKGGEEPSAREVQQLLDLAERLAREGAALAAIEAEPSPAGFLSKLYEDKASSSPRRIGLLSFERLAFASRSLFAGGVVFLGLAVGVASAFTGDPLGLSGTIPFIGNTRTPDAQRPVAPGQSAPGSSPIDVSNDDSPADAAPGIVDQPPGQGGENPGNGGGNGVGVGQGGTPPGQGGENPGNGGGNGEGVGQGGTPPGQGGENPGNGGGNGVGVGQGGTPPGQGGENPGNGGGNGVGVGQGGTPPGQGGENPGNGGGNGVGVGQEGTPPGQGGENPGNGGGNGGGVGQEGTPPGQGGENPGNGGGNGNGNN